jgi:Secretion system C-terminal sorting domain
MKRFIIAATAATLLGWHPLLAQNEFYNDGADVYVQAGGLIFVQGEVINDDQGANVGRIYNSGDIQLTGNWSNTSAVSNVFLAGQPGTTTFLGTGAFQTIGGTMDTYFNNLTINKSAGTVQEVRQLRNSLSDGVLNLTNDFLNTQTFNFLVANPAANAIQRLGPIAPNYTNSMTEGYVTSTPGSTGRLARATGPVPGVRYLFPVGNATRFRPVEVTPSAGITNVYAVQFVNLPTPNTGLKAATLATINPAWYHFIERASATASPEDVRIYHDFTADAICDINNVTMSEWNLSLWADLSTTTSTQNTSPTLSFTHKANYPGAYPTPWVSNGWALAGLFFAPGQMSCVFPVEMTMIRAEALTSSILVEWETASQSNNLGWEVERSTNGRDFVDIGWVDGHGTTNSPMLYDKEDRDVQPGVLYYYRIRQTDINGATHRSEIVTAMLGDLGIAIGDPYPNPSTGQVTIPVSVTEASDLKISVVNMLGQEVFGKMEDLQAGGQYQAVTLDLSKLSQGVYQVNLSVRGKVVSKKLVIE